MSGQSTKNRASPSGPRATQKFPGVLFDGGTVTTATTAIKTISVPGVKTTDILIGVDCIQKTGLAAVPSRVPADDVLEILLINPTAGTITTGTVTYDFCVEHFSL